MDSSTGFVSVSDVLLSHFQQSFPITVLLVDDQKIIAEAVKRMLNDQPDIVFHYCSDPTKALETAAQVKPTVILQDLVMPECDGILLVKYFRANPASRDIPIIVLSTKEDPKVKAEAFAVGANDYIVKLPDKIELVARIRYHSSSYIRLLERNEAYKRIEESQKILNDELAEAAAYVRSLLPPCLKGPIKTEWRFIPSTQLGGDAFGYHWLDENSLAIYLLDVCGHGVGAALLSISVINLLRSQTLPQADFLDPSSVLSALNLAFQMEKQNNMFFTIWYGVYNKITHQITYASGGHPPAILITGETANQAKVYELKTPGVVIGALPEAYFENATIAVQSYNRLYVFSDGVYEITRVGNGPMLELQEFIDMLVAFSQKEKRTLEELVQQIQEIQGKKIFADDFSLLQATFQQST